MGLFSISVSLFFVLNSLGNIPLFVSFLGHYPVKKQRRIILRELLIALFCLLLFNFFGDNILDLIGITRPVIGMAGGILLFLISLSMIFPKEKVHNVHLREPFIFPLAIPLIAGPGAITTVMIYSQQAENHTFTAFAILLAWIPSAIILLASSNIKLLVGPKGLMAFERMGGMLVCLISIHMFTSGTIALVRDNFFPAAT